MEAVGGGADAVEVISRCTDDANRSRYSVTESRSAASGTLATSRSSVCTPLARVRSGVGGARASMVCDGQRPRRVAALLNPGVYPQQRRLHYRWPGGEGKDLAVIVQDIERQVAVVRRLHLHTRKECEVSCFLHAGLVPPATSSSSSIHQSARASCTCACRAHLTQLERDGDLT
jgi:hypothetical protein